MYRQTADIIRPTHFSYRYCYSYIAIMTWLICTNPLAAIYRIQPSHIQDAFEHARQKHSRVTAQSVSLINFDKQAVHKGGYFYIRPFYISKSHP